MGDNNTKWEPVAYGDLKHGDRARITNAKGDVIYGRMESERFTCDFGDVGAWALDRSGYSFERAVPERTLPTEVAFYAVSKRPHVYERLLRFTTSRGWEQMFPRSSTPDDLHADQWIAETAHDEGRLTRLVAATEAEELRERIQAARKYVEHWAGAAIDTATAATILALLDGEAAS